jgi:lipopolysaccharide transport system permease protein
LGMAWSLVNPLLQLGVFYFLFQVVLSLNVRRYSAYMLSGLLAWNWFQASITQAATTITGNRDLLRLHGFPAAVLPVVAVTTNMIHFMIAIPVLVMFLFIGGGSLGVGLLAVPAVMAVQYLFTLGLAYLVAAVNVMFRDTQHLMDLLLRMYMFLNPILYTIDHVPAEYQNVYRLNPTVPLLEAYRAVLMAGAQPDWMGLTGVALLGGVLLASGRFVFHRFSGRFVDEL